MKFKQEPQIVELLTDVAKGCTVNADGQILYNGWDADSAKFIYRAL